MGELLTTIRVGGISHPIKPIPRTLESGGESFEISSVCSMRGGIILGEGDTGKSTYVKMLVEKAREKGPAELVLLRRRNLEIHVPEVPRGKVATIILDGLDEYPECARDIIDFADSVDSSKIHIWVTSRSCDAAERLCESVSFSMLCHLGAFTADDVRALAEECGLDGTAFIRAVEELSLERFLSKPGGTVLLLQLYANGKLKAATRGELLEALLAAGVEETRDGHVLSMCERKYDPAILSDAVCWIATCLVLCGYDAIWTGSVRECPQNDIPLDNLPSGGFNRNVILEALGRRIFEPLNGKRIRISYADMPPFLAARWLALHAPVEWIREHFDKDVVFRGSEELDAILREWICYHIPACGGEWLREKPEKFLLCHEAIRQFGIDGFFRLLCKRFIAHDQFHLPVDFLGNSVRDVRGFAELADYMCKAVMKLTMRAEYRDLAAFLLSSCNVSSDRSARSIIDCIVNGRLGDLIVSRAVRYLGAICGDNEPDEIYLLRPLFNSVKGRRDPCSSIIRGNLARYFNHQEWKDYRKSLLKRTEPKDEDDDDFHVLTEREVSELIRSKGESALAEILMSQELYGKPYQALRPFFRKLIPNSAYVFSVEREALYAAILYDPAYYLHLIVEANDPIQFYEFIIWIEQHGVENAVCAGLGKISAEDAVRLLTMLRLPGLPYDGKLLEPLEAVICENADWDILSLLEECSPVKDIRSDRVLNRISNRVENQAFIKHRNDPEERDEEDEDESFEDPESGEGDEPDTSEERDCPGRLLNELAALAVKPAEPVRAVVVDVAKPVADKLQKAIAETVTTAVKNKGGRPRKTDRAAGYMSQGQVAAMFGKPCTGNTVSNWESYVRSGGKRGARPPEAEFEGHLVVYTSDLREFPTEKNMLKLAALIERYKSTRAVKDNISHKRDTHFKSDETQFRKQVGVQGYLSNERNL